MPQNSQDSQCYNGDHYTQQISTKDLALNKDLLQVMTRPYHSQSNGLNDYVHVVEKSMQIVKLLLTKAKFDDKDSY